MAYEMVGVYNYVGVTLERNENRRRQQAAGFLVDDKGCCLS